MTLLDKLRAATEGSRELDAEVQFHLDWVERAPEFDRVLFYETGGYKALIGEREFLGEAHAHYTTNLQCARKLLLEGFWWTAGECALSGHANVGPDYNGPHGDRLRKEYPEAQWHEGICVDVEDGENRVERALVIAALEARTTDHEAGQ